jgi:tetrahydromethanopterin S-methyltransferase subunit C
MIDFIAWIMDRVPRHLWWIGAIVLAGLVFLLSGDFTWSNAIFSLLVLIFLAIAFIVVTQVRRAVTSTQEQKDP